MNYLHKCEIWTFSHLNLDPGHFLPFWNSEAQIFLRNFILRLKMFLPKVRDLSLIVLIFLVFIQPKHSCSYMLLCIYDFIDTITLTYLDFNFFTFFNCGILSLNYNHPPPSICIWSMYIFRREPHPS